MRSRLSRLLLPAAVLFVAGCTPKFHPANLVDFDGDGFFAYGSLSDLAGLTISELDDLKLDCDDEDDNVFPGAAELCDGVDNNCARAELCEGVDNCEDAWSSQERDDDGDGFTECGYDPVNDEISSQLDCNDDPANFGAYQAPDHTELCAMPPTDTELLGPGVEDLARPTQGLDDDCDGAVEVGEHARDQDRPPGGSELVDNDDPEGDSLGIDCDDNNANVNPSIGVAGTGAEDVAVTCATDDFDSNCSEPSPSTPRVTWYPDCDQDGDGSEETTDWEFLCQGEQPSGSGIACEFNGTNWFDTSLQPDAPNTDCDDGNDVLNGLDEDGDTFDTCDRGPDNPSDTFLSGLVSADNPITFPGAQYAFPGACERCDQIDNDLDGQIDEGYDQDNDGSVFTYADSGSCSEPYPAGITCEDVYGPGQIDCDDTEASLNQNDDDGDGNTTCDSPADCNDGDATVQGIDNDLDGSSTCDSPPDCDDSDPNLYPFDLDGDSFTTCQGDCLDDPSDGLSPSVFPGNGVQCDGVPDTDCDGVEDPLEVDADSDGSTECDGDCDDANAALNAVDADGDGYSTCQGDCDDNDDDVHPGAAPLCDGITDNDCNGIADPNEADADNDGDTVCDGDCNDFDAALYFSDNDGDGYSTCEADCDDADSSLNLRVDSDGDGRHLCGATGVPADCDDNDTDENWTDVDGDTSTTCDAVPDCDDSDASLHPLDDDNDGQSSCNNDCDDGNSSILAGGSEGSSADGLDNDCGGTADESLIAAGDLAITELMIGADPATTDGYGEYVEVINASGHDLDLRGWEVTVENDVTGASTTFTFAEGTDAAPVVLAPGERFVLAHSTNDLGYGYDIADAYWAAAGLSDSGGEITFGYGSVTVDVVDFGPSGCFSNCSSATSPNYTGPSYWRTGYAMSLKESFVTGGAPAAGNNNMSNWCEERDPLGSNGDHGSPGEAPSALGPCG